MTFEKPASLRLHTQIGLAFGLLMLLLSLSGGLAAIGPQIAAWEKALSAPAQPQTATCSPADIAFQVQREAGQGAGWYAIAFEEDVASAIIEGVDGRERAFSLSRADCSDAAEGKELSTALADHFANLHMFLLLWSPFGERIVGFLGLVLCVFAISGLIIHPSLRRWFVHPPASTGRKPASWSRWFHQLSTLWSLPAIIFFGFSGAALVAYSVGLATPLTDSRRELVDDGFDASVSGPPIQLEAPAPEVAVGKIFKHFQRIRPDFEWRLMEVYQSRAEGGRVYLLGAQPGAVLTELHSFRADGTYLGDRAAAAPETLPGHYVLRTLHDIHTADLFAPPLRIGFLLFGILLAAGAATGMLMWVFKGHGQRLAPWPRVVFAAVLGAFGYVLPLTLIRAVGEFQPWLLSRFDLVAVTLFCLMSGLAAAAEPRRATLAVVIVSAVSGLAAVGIGMARAGLDRMGVFPVLIGLTVAALAATLLLLRPKSHQVADARGAA